MANNFCQDFYPLFSLVSLQLMNTIKTGIMTNSRFAKAAEHNATSERISVERSGGGV